MSGEALKPCPFCGANAARLVTRREGQQPLYGVECEACACGTSPRMALKEFAITAWNTRAQQHAPTQREGWVLVPREPTEEMIQAAMATSSRDWKKGSLEREKYRSMLSAVPSGEPDDGS